MRGTIRRSCAEARHRFRRPDRRQALLGQITRRYTPGALVGQQVLAVGNVPPRQIGPMMSEVLTLGVPDADGEVVSLRPALQVPDGGALLT